jgi:hypothetical protein
MPIRAENRKKREMETYLVQIQVKKPNGKVHLISVKREAQTPLEAYETIAGMSAGSGEIIGAYVTGDPKYKIIRFGTGE